MSRMTVALAALAACLVADMAAAADEGKQLYLTRTCVACHGRGGAKAIQMYPHLAGLPRDYLYIQMKAIAAGERVSGPDARGYPRTQAMKDIMGIVTDDELKTIAAWLEAQPAPPLVKGDDTRIKRGAEVFEHANCVTCHGAAGSAPLEGIPPVAGQKKEYLLLQIKEIRGSVRKNGQASAMTAMVESLSDEDADAVAEYLASTERKPAK